MGGFPQHPLVTTLQVAPKVGHAVPCGVPDEQVVVPGPTPDRVLVRFQMPPLAVAQVGVPDVASTPSVQLKVFAPVVGAVASVEVPVEP